jgi:outer membrane receptor protein involved in Fe transport
VWGKLGVSVNGSAFDTDGFPIVAAAERGRIDNNAKVQFGNINAKADYTVNSRMSAFFRAGYFSENRDNGKISTFEPRGEEANSTRWTSTSGGVRVILPDQSALQARYFTDNETFRSNFLAVPPSNPARSIGRFTLNQRVPTTSVGGMVEWARSLGSRNYLSVGTDWRWVDGDSQEDVLDAARGTQRSVGAYVQDIAAVTPRLTMTLSARVDHWRNYDAHNLETSLPSGAPGAGNRPTLPDRDDTVVSPHAAAIYHVNDRVSFWGAVNSAFRAPTLNELYRQFRVGAVLTLANENLGPERLVGGEAGLNLLLARDLTIRTVWFANHVKNPVLNVTIASTPSQTTQQRQNLGRTSIWGAQTDVEYRFRQVWLVSGGYFYNQATVLEFAVNPALIGKFLPQVPEHRGSFRVSYADPKYLTVTVGAQLVGRQFDDDQNVRRVPGFTDPGLPNYALWELTASRALNRNIEIFAGVQNIGDRTYYVGTQPTTIGSPRLMNVGARIRFSGK